MAADEVLPQLLDPSTYPVRVLARPRQEREEASADAALPSPAVDKAAGARHRLSGTRCAPKNVTGPERGYSLLDDLFGPVVAGFPNQPRDTDGRWRDAIPGPDIEKLFPGQLARLLSYDEADYESDFGGRFDEFPFFGGEAHVRIFEDGSAHISNDFKEDGEERYQPMTLQLSSGELSAVEEALTEAVNIDREDYEDDDGDVAEDEFGAIDSFDGGGLRFAPYGNGDIQVRIPHPLYDWEGDRSEQHAWDLSEEDAEQFRKALIAAVRVQVDLETDLEEEEEEREEAASGEVTVRACMPPKVAVPKPGPCPGSKRGVKSLVKTLTKPVRKATAKPKAAPAPAPARKAAAKPKAAPAPPPARKAAAKPKVSPAPARSTVPEVESREGGPATGRNVSQLLESDSLAALPMYDANLNDQRLVAIAKEQGFDAPARIRDARQLDEAVRQGGREMWRGVVASDQMSAKAIHERSNVGPSYYGQGQFGNGVYYSSDRKRAAAFGDGKPGAVQRAVLPANARVISYPELLKAMEKDFSQEASQYQEKGRTLLNQLARGRSGQDFRAAWNQYKYTRPSHVSPIDSLKTEPGAWAMAHGYDAYVVPAAGSLAGAEEIVVLNRSALLAEGQPVRGGGRTPRRARTASAASLQARRVPKHPRQL